MNAQCTWTTKYEIFTFFCFGVHQPWRRGVVNVSILGNRSFQSESGSYVCSGLGCKSPFCMEDQVARGWWTVAEMVVNEIRLRSLIRNGVYTRLRRALSIGIGNGILFIQCYQHLPKITVVLVPKLCRFHRPRCWEWNSCSRISTLYQKSWWTNSRKIKCQ